MRSTARGNRRLHCCAIAKNAVAPTRSTQPLALLILVVALDLSGVFEVGTSLQGAGSGLASRKGLIGSFFTGALSVVVAAPCTAPFMGPALGWALTYAVVYSLAGGIFHAYYLVTMAPSFWPLLTAP